MISFVQHFTSTGANKLMCNYCNHETKYVSWTFVVSASTYHDKAPGNGRISRHSKSTEDWRSLYVSKEPFSKVTHSGSQSDNSEVRERPKYFFRFLRHQKNKYRTYVIEQWLREVCFGLWLILQLKKDWRTVWDVLKFLQLLHVADNFCMFCSILYTKSQWRKPWLRLWAGS